jgi:PAS domain S-box-containing protein
MYLNALLRRTADGVCGVDRGGKVALWTRSAEKILGYSAREVVGRPCCEIFIGRDDPSNGLCYQGCHGPTPIKRNEPVQDVAIATRTKAGKPVWLHINILDVPGAEPDAPMTVHLFRDVTAAKEIEALVRARLLRIQRPVSPERPSPTELTRRELEVLRLMVNGANTQTMAGRLRVSPITVRNHVQNILRKLNVHSRLEAVAYVIRHGIV